MFGDMIQHEQVRGPKNQVDIEDGHNPHQDGRLISQKDHVDTVGFFQEKW